MTAPLSPAPALTAEVTDRTDATDEEFRARVAVFDAAEEPEGVAVERVARALLRSDLDARAVGDPPSRPVSDYRRLAAAALAALRGDRGPLAGQHTTDEEQQR